MKLNRIQISNFLGARAVDVALTNPVTLIAGHNGAGKSSIQEAVRMAMTGEAVRVSLKKEYSALMSEGAESGFAEVTTDQGEVSIVLPTGKGSHSNNQALPFVLDAQRFARLDANERRSFLFGLMGVRTDGLAVKDRLLTRGCDAATAEQIAPYLRAGFDAAAKEAASKARDAKAAWKTVTGGETWGEKKAAGWSAAAPAVAAGTLPAAEQAVAAADEALAAANRDLGALQEKAQAAGTAQARMEDLRERAGRYARIADKLARDRAELAQWSSRLAELPPVGEVVRPQTSPCPACGAILCGTAGGLAIYEQIEIPAYRDDAEAAGKRKQWQDAVDLYLRAVTAGERDLAAADAAAEALKQIEAEAADAPSEGAILEAKSRVEAMRNERRGAQQRLDEIKAAQRAAAEADRKTAEAARHHADVLAWTEIADALSPDGIPGELLAAALGPINARLAAQADAAQWPAVAIDADMAITYGGRPYALCSESEQWRADALIAEAVAHLSGLRLIVLDRADVLDMAGREDLLYWLGDLAADGEIDTALVFATLKGMPAALPPRIGAVWIERGRAGQMREAA